MESPPENSSSLRQMFRRWNRIASMLRLFGRNHAGLLIRGSVAALFVVGARLALPWPLRTMLRPLLHSSNPAENVSTAWLPAGWNPALTAGVLFLIFMAILGLADLLVRLYFARFAIATAVDLRAAVYNAMVRCDPRVRSSFSGDLVARLIGDTQRLKTGLKSFFVHIITNGILFAGVVGVLLWMDRTLGLIFTIAGIATLTITAQCAGGVYSSSLKSRAKEGKRANHIHKTFALGPKDGVSEKLKSTKGYSQASVTLHQGIATWVTHVVFGFAVLSALWFGSKSVAAGRLDAGHIVVFMLYTVMMRAPIVRLARQGARAGTIFAAGDRLVSLSENTAAAEDRCRNAKTILPLNKAIRLNHVTVKGSKERGRRRLRFACIEMEFHPGEKVAVVGGAGSGKTTLLELLAGMRIAKSGVVSWDGINLAEANPWKMSDHVAFVPLQPVWPRQSVRELLGVDATGPDEATRQWLMTCGVEQMVSRLPENWGTRISSADLSPGERRLLEIARAVRQHKSVLLLDDPFSGMPGEDAVRPLDALLAGTPYALVVLSMSRATNVERFDRVIELAGGHVIFDGSSDDWLAMKERQPAVQIEGVAQTTAVTKGSR